MTKERGVDLGPALAVVKRVSELLSEKAEGDIYTRAFSDVFDVPLEEVTAKDRNWVKVLTFGTRYSSGMMEKSKVPDAHLHVKVVSKPGRDVQGT